MTALTIQRGTAIEYLPPPAAQPASYLVRLVGERAGAELTGWGESLPRDDRTAGEPDESWQFLTHALETLPGSRIPVDDQRASLQEVRRLTERLARLATERAGPAGGHTPFRGTLLGIEVAILDLVARSRKVSLADLLGAERGQVEVAPPRISLDQEPAELVDAYRSRTGAIRFALGDDPDASLRALRRLARRIDPPERAGRWWLAAGGELTPAKLDRLLAGLVKGMRRGWFAPALILEQPLPSAGGAELATLQRRVDRLGARRFWRGRALDLRVMPGAGPVTAEDLTALTGEGGCRAIQVDCAQIGGLLATVELVRTAVEQRPDLLVALTPPGGASDLSTWALYHLGLALPRLDCFTTAPASAEHVSITDPEPGFRPATRILRPPRSDGLGARVALDAILPDTGRYHHGPGSDGPVLHGRRANRYPEERHTRFMGKNALRSHAVEREALAHGLATTRYGSTVFVAHDDAGTQLMFGNSARSPVSGACSFMIADQHKGAAHALLARAGVPVPPGRVFAVTDLAGATRYARALGYPVVSKPVSGTGGTGVTTNIPDDQGLAGGFEAIRAHARHAREDVLVERHVPGEVYRIIVHGDQVTAAAMREPASVTGDGVRPVAELIVEKNAYRQENPRLRKGLIVRDEAASHLRDAGLSLDHVPDPGERVFLSDRPYLRNGGDWIEVLEELHPTIAETAVRAVAAVPELRFCGVDILLEDHRRPIDQQAAGICELNACPELVSPQYPLFGEPRLISRRLLRTAAERRGVRLAPEPVTGELTVRITVEGPAVGAGYQAWFLDRACALALTGWVAPAGDGRVEAVARGGVVPVSTLASTAIVGPGRPRPTVVTTRHTEAPVTDRFVRRDSPEPAATPAPAEIG